MPMSRKFTERLEKLLPEILCRFPTPFHMYDEQGIIESATRLKRAFSGLNFREFFAVKALPNREILRILHREGFGFDCSSIPELTLSAQVGAMSESVMFTSNNTSQSEFLAAQNMKAILNLDDITMIKKVPDPFPERICFRFNPGKKRTGNTIIGKPEEAKYGLREDQIVEAYRLAQSRGAKIFGLHTMVASNELDYQYMVETVRMLLSVAEQVVRELGIRFEFINMGGGIGIPYHPDQDGVDIELMGKEITALMKERGPSIGKGGNPPWLYMESGRFMTGPHGVLVTSVINRMSKHREYVGVDACMSALMRPALYGAYHHITVFGKDAEMGTEVVDVVGSLCENNDKFAIQRALPVVVEGYILFVHDTGAHGYAMGFNYNGRLRPAELLLGLNGRVRMIRRAETQDDLFATMNPKTFTTK